MSKFETQMAVEYVGTYLSPNEIELLADAVERAETDPMAFVEVGRIYCQFIKDEIVRQADEAAVQWALTDKVRTL